MNQEERELLITDLGMRVPYGVHLWVQLDLSYDTMFDEVYQVGEFEAELEGINMDDSVYLTIFHEDSDSADYLNQYVQTCPCTIYDIKPYLRPMSSMTDEERKEWCDGMFKVAMDIFKRKANGDDTADPGADVFSLDWLNAHHFDYRHLIEKGLALPAPEGMYK